MVGGHGSSREGSLSDPGLAPIHEILGAGSRARERHTPFLERAARGSVTREGASRAVASFDSATACAGARSLPRGADFPALGQGASSSASLRFFDLAPSRSSRRFYTYAGGLEPL